MKKLTKTQRRILENVDAGRRVPDGMPGGRSASGGWGGAITSCHRNGWLCPDGKLTDAGHAALTAAREADK